MNYVIFCVDGTKVFFFPCIHKLKLILLNDKMELITICALLVDKHLLCI